MYEHPRTMFYFDGPYDRRVIRDGERVIVTGARNPREGSVKASIFGRRKCNGHKAHRGTLTEARRRKGHRPSQLLASQGTKSLREISHFGRNDNYFELGVFAPLRGKLRIQIPHPPG